MAAAFRQHPLLASGFMLAFAVTVFFAARLIVLTVYWMDPVHQDQTLQGWMTPGYVANSWDLPRSELQAAIGDLTQAGERKSLEQLAEESGIPLAEVISRIEAAIAAHRAAQ